MSHTVSLTKLIYDSARFKTPNVKDVASSSSEQSNEVTPNPPILMDEYGQTPDHYYLAKKPSSIFQVKRKLDLQTYEAAEESSEYNKPTKRRRKSEAAAPKPKAKSVADKPRYDTSLGQLTKKFLKLLSDAADGVINLNTACTLLSVPKRRLYDITNVLEGAGLIQKTSRNNIQWMGRNSSPCPPNVGKYELEKEIDILEAKENKLDELIYHMKSEINALKENEGKYHYVTGDDLKNIEEFSKKMVVGVNIAPTGQVIETFEDKVVLTSNSSEIQAYLLDDDSFMNILHPGAEFKENSYNVTLCHNLLASIFKEETLKDPFYGLTTDPYSFYNSSYSRMCAGNTWSEGDMVIKNAFITEEDDIAPMGKNFLLQTEDQDLDIMPFPEFEPDNYSFSLDDGEGLTDLFDCNFPCP